MKLYMKLYLTACPHSSLKIQMDPSLVIVGVKNQTSLFTTQKQETWDICPADGAITIFISQEKKSHSP